MRRFYKITKNYKQLKIYHANRHGRIISERVFDLIGTTAKDRRSNARERIKGMGFLRPCCPLWDGTRFKEKLEDNCIHVNEIAELVGVSRQAVSDWINGTVPLGQNLVKICEILYCEPNDLFSFH